MWHLSNISFTNIFYNNQVAMKSKLFVIYKRSEVYGTIISKQFNIQCIESMNLWQKYIIFLSTKLPFNRKYVMLCWSDQISI